MTAPDYQPKVANPFTEDGPAGEVFDADTITLITQLGLSLGERATQLAADNAGLRAERDLLRREINERNQLITGLLGHRDDLSSFEVRPGPNLGDVVREQVLMLIDRLDAKAADAARRSHDIDIVADLCGDRFLAAQIVDALDVNEGTR